MSFSMEMRVMTELHRTPETDGLMNLSPDTDGHDLKPFSDFLTIKLTN